MNLATFSNFFFNIGIMLMFVLPLFPAKFRPIIIGFFSLGVVLSFIVAKERFNVKRFILNGSIYLFIVFSLLYSENVEYAVKKLESMSSLIIFSIIFSIFPSHKLQNLYNNRHLYMFVYVIAIAVMNLSFFAYHFGHYKSTLITHYLTVTDTAQGGYNIHPIYLSMHICVAIIFSWFLLKKANKHKAIILISINIVLVFFLLILLKKGPIIGLGIAFTVFVLFQKTKKWWIIYLSILVISIFSIMSIPKLKFKFAEVFKIENIEGGKITSSNIRYSIYGFAKETIIKSPIIGHGIGDYRDELIETYKDSPLLYQGKYNSHNQYLSFLISIGIVGLVLFVIMLSYNFILAIINNNLELILLLIFYCFVMSFENILEREDGVLYFCFFIGMFSLFSGIEKHRNGLDIETIE